MKLDSNGEADNANEGEPNHAGTSAGQSESEDEILMYPNRDEFYDSEMDDQDEKWLFKSLNIDPSQTDAIVSCPACFTIVSMLCQRHESFSNQYRAIFVQNVSIDMNKFVQPVGNIELEHGEHYRQVSCKTCNTEVGVIDNLDVYHFYHVLPNLSG